MRFFIKDNPIVTISPQLRGSRGNLPAQKLLFLSAGNHSFFIGGTKGARGAVRSCCQEEYDFRSAYPEYQTDTLVSEQSCLLGGPSSGRTGRGVGRQRLARRPV